MARLRHKRFGYQVATRKTPYGVFLFCLEPDSRTASGVDNYRHWAVALPRDKAWLEENFEEVDDGTRRS
jgi:hypothetical protein